MKKIAIASLLALICWLYPVTVLAQKTDVSQTEVKREVTSPTNELDIVPKPKIEAPKPAAKTSFSRWHYSETCEAYRPIIKKYFGVQTDQAIFVASKESGCRMSAVSRTADYCLFQIHNEPLTTQDVDMCVRRAWEKYVGGRVGSFNWSAWYAVCTPGNNPQPKYPDIKCN